MASGGNQGATSLPSYPQRRNRNIRLQHVTNLKLHWYRRQSLGGAKALLDRCMADRVVTFANRKPLVVNGKTLQVRQIGKANRELVLDGVPDDISYEEMESQIEPWLEQARRGLGVNKIIIDREKPYATTVEQLDDYHEKLLSEVRLFGVDDCALNLLMPKDKDFKQVGWINLHAIQDAKTVTSHAMFMNVHGTPRRVSFEMDLTLNVYINTKTYLKLGASLRDAVNGEIKELESLGERAKLNIQSGVPDRHDEDDTCVKITLKPSSSYAYKRLQDVIYEYTATH